MTILHEVLHIIGFIDFKENDRYKDYLILNSDKQNRYKNLSDLSEKGSLTKLYHEGHWNEGFLPNDIMTARARLNQILTIFTLEMIENFSPELVAIPENLPKNWLLESIDDKSKFLKY